MNCYIADLRIGEADKLVDHVFDGLRLGVGDQMDCV